MNERGGHIVKQKILILLPNNTNQDVWLRGVRNYAQAHNCALFLLNKYNKSRELSATDLTYNYLYPFIGFRNL